MDPFAGLRAPTPAVAPAPAPEAPKPVLDPEAAAESFYGGPRAPTRSAVDWNEPPALAAEYDLQDPSGVWDTSDVGRAAMLRLRDGFAEAGAGRSIAREMFDDATRAQQGSLAAVSQAAAERELRQEFGARYEQRMEAARGLIRQVSQRCPEVISFLEGTGLGNHPDFIRKVIAAAGRKRGGR